MPFSGTPNLSDSLSDLEAGGAKPTLPLREQEPMASLRDLKSGTTAGITL